MNRSLSLSLFLSKKFVASKLFSQNPDQSGDREQNKSARAGTVLQTVGKLV